jgi:hypothetical protein
MEHPHILRFELEQHTPLIHFQPEQAGAGLRGTEVKPKLDKFVITNLGSGNYLAGLKLAFETGYLQIKLQLDSNITPERQFDLVSKSKNHALDYSIRIVNVTKEPMPLIRKNDKNLPGFFANMGDDYQERGLGWTDSISVVVMCKNAGLKNLLDTIKTDFFFRTNFGMRSTKGYGSFTLKESSTSPALRYFKVATQDWLHALRYLDLFYKSLRGGINGAIHPNTERYVRDFYMKPLIFQYAVDNGVKWEKKIIKQVKGFQYNSEKFRIYGKDLINQQNDWPKEDTNIFPLWAEGQPRIVRDLLGLSTEQSWMGYGPWNNRKSEYIAETIKKADTEEKIDRFTSPIVFKPVLSSDGFRIYLITSDIPEEYLKSKIRISVGEKIVGDYNIWKEFSITHFIDSYIKKSRIAAACRIKHGERAGAEIMKMLEDMYECVDQSIQQKKN